ncbi:hypothetical protein [Mucilaginibacter sp. UYCu711]|uniref:hypothetical protein n=1 Tax=Mucilaginibacter sp. UYCu711 TaxID=3156339 RepID=UPI003D252B0B
MKRNTFLEATFCCALLLLVIGISCKKSLHGSTDAIILPPDISWAQEYYNNALQPEQGNTAVSLSSKKTLSDPLSKKANMKTLFWQKAVSGKEGDYDFVEIPLKYTQKVTTTLTITVNGVKTSEDPSGDVIKGTVDRLVIYKNKAGNIYQKIISYVPDAKYLQKHNGDITQNKINKLDSDFDGYVFHKKWDGTILFVLKISGGQVVKRYNYIKTDRPKAAVQVNSVVCETVEIYEWFVDCFYEGDSPYPYKCGEPYREYVGTGEYCYDDGSDIDCSDPVNLGNPRCAPGQGEQDPTPKLSKIMKYPTGLTAAQKAQIEALLTTLNNRCIGAAIYNYMDAHSQTFYWDVNSSLTQNAAYSPPTDSIKIKNPSTPDISGVQEEMFHAYQNKTYPGGTTQYLGTHAGSANIEFEAKVMRDLQGLITNDGSSLALNSTEYFTWLSDISSSFTKYPASFTADQLTRYFSFVTDFINAGTGYGNRVANSLEPSAMFSLINSSGCAH